MVITQLTCHRSQDCAVLTGRLHPSLFQVFHLSRSTGALRGKDSALLSVPVHSVTRCSLFAEVFVPVPEHERCIEVHLNGLDELILLLSSLAGPSSCNQFPSNSVI